MARTDYESIQMKTSELTGAALDWAVAKCEGYTDYCGQTDKMLAPRKEYGWVCLSDITYTTDWAQGGPILNNAKISRTIDDTGRWIAYSAYNYAEEKQWMHCDRSELVAGLRCFVESQLGDEVDVPNELT